MDNADFFQSAGTDVVALATQVVWAEAHALKVMAERLDDEFRKAVDLILSMRGRVVVIGMGKSGIIGKKIVATFASTGTPALFVHPGEALHGDLGMIRPDDVALMISKSGETEELIRLLPFLQQQRNRIVALTGRIGSTLARHAQVALDVSVPSEACKNNLVPTSSTTATLVMGDALAVVLSTLRGFEPEDFARFHPGGSLGRRLLARVGDLMHANNLPFCRPGASFREVVHTITCGRLGLALVREQGVLLGIITDGDIRRAFERCENPLGLVAGEIMTPDPKTIRDNVRFSEAEELMRELKINSLIVKDAEGAVAGVLQIFDAGM